MRIEVMTPDHGAVQLEHEHLHVETGAKFLHAFDASESAHLATFREWIYWRVLPNPDTPTPDNN